MSIITFNEVEKCLARAASSGIRPGLERIGRLLNLLGNPQNDWPALHVVGTNGKGSTCAFLASVLRASGYRTALYTSPHLESPGERLLIDGNPLSASEWLDAAKTVTAALDGDPALKADPPSYFELVTAAAFLLASQNKAEVGVIEAGLGGRMDATNLLGNVACSVVASISMDHMEFLGPTLEGIASEKFAVVRPDTPACFMGDNHDLIQLFRIFCAENHALPFIVPCETRLENVSVTDQGCSFDFDSPNLKLAGVHTRMIGRYQLNNAALALSALSRVLKDFPRITPSAIREGMEKACWPGRLEIFSRNPFVILDGGHNRDGVEKMARSVADLWPHHKIGVVYAVMRDKDYNGCLDLLNSLHPTFYATSVPEMGRSLPAVELLSAAEKFSWRNIPRAFESPLNAVQVAVSENDLVLVCGSLYLIGWIRPKLRKILEG